MNRIDKGKWVVCAGDVLIDMIVPYGEMKRHMRLLACGEKPEGPKPRPLRQPGGTIGNTAAVLARLGVPTAVAGRLSAESGGRFLMEDLQAHGVNTDFVVRQGPDIFMMIGVLDEGERVMFNWHAPEVEYKVVYRGDLTDELVDATGLAYISGVNVIAASDQEAEFAGYAERCKKRGAKVAFDLNLRVETFGFGAARRSMVERIIAASDIVFGSGAEEFGALTGAPDFEASVDALEARYKGKIIVARNGALPAVLIADGQRSSYPPLEVEVVNKVGAGDAFNAGFLAAYCRGLDLQTAMKHGTACACFAISRPEARAVPDEQTLAAMVAAQR